MTSSFLTKCQEEHHEGDVESLHDVDPEAPASIQRRLGAHVVERGVGGQQLGGRVVVKHTHGKL